MSGRWVSISELLDRYEQAAAEQETRRLERRSGWDCPACGASYAREASLQVHLRRAHPRRHGGRRRAPGGDAA